MPRLAAFASAASMLCISSVPASDALAQGAPMVRSGGTVTLNPQPLPPKARWRKVRRDPTTGKTIIIVSGKKIRPKPGGPVMLNPQPLPPKVLQAQ